jgi:hypothetical protein
MWISKLLPRQARRHAATGMAVCLAGWSLYLQGRGLATLVATEVLPTADTLDLPAWEPLEVHALQKPQATGVQSLRDRNPFDSKMPSLRPPPPAEPSPPMQARERLDPTDPLSAPICEGARAYVITEFSDPALSVATVQPKGHSHGRAVQIGGAVGDFEVVYIGYNRRERSPAVWLLNEGDLCQALVFGDEDRFESALNRRAQQAARQEAREQRALRAKKTRQERARKARQQRARKARARRRR